MMRRGKMRFRNEAVPAVSSFIVIFGSALLSLAILSFISARVLDNEHWSPSTNLFPSALFPKPSPAKVKTVKLTPAEKLAAFLVKYGNQTIDPVEELRTLHSVPAVWDVGKPFLWESENSEWHFGCSDASSLFPSGPPLESNGYLFIAASGGLNQQRTGITDAVVVAKLLNATLVVPQLDHKSYWKDHSNFSDIFDVDSFISSVAQDVLVVKEPVEALRGKGVYTRGVPRKAKPEYYLSQILPMLKKKKVILNQHKILSMNPYNFHIQCLDTTYSGALELLARINAIPAIRLNRFDYRLSNKLDSDWQKLRCRTNYKALRFTRSIQEIGQTLVDRMRAKSGGRFIALHLRYEPDMLAFSGCYYGGGFKEVEELGLLRKRWKTIHNHDPERSRRHGKCPLTPKEVGLMLRGLGYGQDTFLYVASGEVYNGEDSLAPLKALFPNYFTKETLTLESELAPFREFSSRMAAVDYVVCSQSDVFVTNNNGNMARILAGERRYHGHKRTIRPNVKKLNNLFSVFQQTPWEEFASEVQRVQKGYMGDPNEVKIGRGEFHEHPLVCICAKPGAPPAPEEEIKQVPQSAMPMEGEEGLETADENIQEEGEEATKEEEDDLPMIIEDEREREHESGVQVISLEGEEILDWRTNAKGVSSML